MNEIILSVKDLKIHYATKRGLLKAVDGVTFSVAKSQNLGLVGESGCGKTTAAKSILRLLPKNASIAGGEILLKGRDLTKLPLEEIRKLRWQEVSMIPQSAMNALDPVYTVGEQIVEAIKAHSHVTHKEAMERVNYLFDLVGINPERINDYPHQFSGGMKQRVTIAMALALNPSLILADEPTTALDVIVQAQILKRIRELQEAIGSSMIMVTHDMSVISETCDHVAVMYAGKVVESGPIKAIFEEACHPYTLGLRNAFPSIFGEAKRLISIPGTPPNLISPPPGCLFRPRCPFAVEICSVQEPAMVEVSLGHRVACHRIDKVDEIREMAAMEETWSKIQAV
ncbi:MAG TPA: ABC transporter ATP-binding protein [Thermosynergistes sp.]|nr:ABC transporter ATP-binding protein [Thermosynergistes sp.]